MEADTRLAATQIIAAKDAWDVCPHPLRRYGARIFDIGLFGSIAFYLVIFLCAALNFRSALQWFQQDASWKHLLIYSPLSWLSASTVIAPLLAWKGTTPGKFLFGLRVMAWDGKPIGLGRAFKREALLLFWGAGFAIVFFSLVMMIRSYNEVDKGAEARWDEMMNLRVEGRTVTGWQSVGVAVGSALVVLFLVWNFVERMAANRHLF